MPEIEVRVERETNTDVQELVEVAEADPVKLSVGLGGPPGPPGPQGPEHSTYTHNQTSTSATWTITHNLSRHPSVTVVDSAGSKVHGDVDYVSDNQVVLTFSGPFQGKAYLN